MSAKCKRAYDATINKRRPNSFINVMALDYTLTRLLVYSNRRKDSPCALTLCASNGVRARAKFVHVKINACLELAPASNKRLVNRPPKKKDARAFNSLYTEAINYVIMTNR